MKDDKLSKGIRRSYRTLIVISALVVAIVVASVYYLDNRKAELVAVEPDAEDPDRVENGIHIRTGFIDAPGMEETIINCTSCHSAELVIQNRMNKERWHATIDWMQESQNLWDLGENEEIIVNYLIKNYPVIAKGRRAELKNIEWYDLQN